MTRWIPLAEAMSPECGGKARGLARLIGAGLRVPDGFVLVGVREAEQVDFGIVLDRLGPGPHAVRSSATAEDGEQQSYAGQYETVLGVVGTDALRDAIDRCFSSLTSERVHAYEGVAAERGANMSVIVQRMVDARCAGVLFTIDPIHPIHPIIGTPDRWTIEAVSGLGEALVSGHASPDRHQVDPEQPEPPIHSSVAGTPVLRAGELSQLVEQARRFTAGDRLDMEWAIDQHGEIHWLQARPITRVGGLALDELDTKLSSPGFGFTRYNLGEILPGAVTPMTASSVVELIDGAMLRCYARMGLFAGSIARPERCLVVVSGHVFLHMHAPYLFAASVAGASKEAADRSLGGRVFDELEGMPLRSKLRRLWTALRMLPVLWRSSQLIDRVGRSVAATLEREPNGDPVAELEAALQLALEVGEAHMLASTWSGMLAGALEQTISGGVPLDPDQRRLYADLLAGIGAVESAQIGVDLAALAELMRSDPSAHEALARDDATLLAWLRGPASGRAGQAFGELLERHGHRCIRELELREPSWAEAPGPLLDALRTAVANPPRERREQVSLERLALPTKSARAIRWMVPRVHASIRLRERGKSLLVRATRALERRVVALGEQLVSSGRLAELDLVYFLTRDELIAATRSGSDSLTPLARRRRRALARQTTLRFAMVSRDKPTPLPPTPARVGAERLVGTAVSPGIVEGRARVARSIADARELVAGEILIVPYTDVGWTPYFELAAGIATEIGGTLSHGAVVAREMGVPAIVDLEGATELFATGQLVRLDADAGELIGL